MMQAMPMVPPQTGLLGAASNYQYPLTSGLLSSLGSGSLGSAPAGIPNYSAMALQMAGNPQAGPLASVPVPSGQGIPGASVGSSGGGGSNALAGLLTAAAQNPGLVKNAVNGISGLLGGGAPTAAQLASDAIPANAALAATTTNGAPYYLAADTGAPAAAPLGSDVLAGSAPAAAAPAADAGLLSAAPAAAAPAADAGLLGGAAPATAYGADLAAETAAPAAADAAAAGGAADAGGAAAAGSLGLGLAGVGAVLAPVLYGMSQPPYTTNQTYYARTGAAMGRGFAPGQSGFPVLESAAMNPGNVSPEMWQQFAQYGITPQNVQQMFQKYAQQPLAPGTPVGGGRGGAPA